MKRCSWILLAMAGVCLSAGLAGADDELELPPVHAGLGVSFGSDNLILIGGDLSFVEPLPFGFTNFYVPILMYEKFKLEPGFGYLRMATSSENDTESSWDNFRFDLGMSYTPRLNRTLLHLGLRLGISHYAQSSSFGNMSEESDKTDFFIGPAVGAEYFLSPQFSIGAEIQLLFIFPDTGEGGGSRYMISNRTHLFIRFYFTSPEEKKEKERPAKPPRPAPVHPQQQPLAEAAPFVPPPKPAPAPEPPPKPEAPDAEKPAKETTIIETPRCPAGAEKVGKVPPYGWEQYCATTSAAGNLVKNGWFRSWYESGQLASRGDFSENLRDGAWTFFHSNGKKRLEAGYRSGKKHGTWLFWDRDGTQTRKVEYRDDAEVP